MQILSAIAGLVLIGVILVDGFQAMVLLRRVTWLWRPTRLFYRAAWAFWGAIARLLPAGKRRANCLSVFGPLSMFALFIIWVFGLVAGFALLAPTRRDIERRQQQVDERGSTLSLGRLLTTPREPAG